MLDRRASVRKLAATSPEAADVLAWYGLPMSEFTVEDACRAADIDPEDVWAELEATGADLDDDDDDDDDDDHHHHVDW